MRFVMSVMYLFALISSPNLRSRALSLRNRLVCNRKMLTSQLSSVSKSEQTTEGGRKSAALSHSPAIFQPLSEAALSPPKGTRDFYPEDFRLKHWLFSEWRSVAASFGFEEYDAPVLESEELYTRKSGEEITEQLYNFTDKGGRRVSLRPEMTPSLARMIVAKRNSLPLPLKWFSIPQCWRYERMTRGRRREHYQWNMDILGVKGVEAEVELLAAIVAFFKRIGLTATDVGIKINSRKVLQDIMAAYGIPSEHWNAVCLLVDKLDKVGVEVLVSDCTKLGVDAEVSQALFGAMKEVDSLGLTVDSVKAKARAGSVCSQVNQGEGMKELRTIFELAKAYGIEDWLKFDPSVVRGLSYYTGTVFEGFDRSGQLRAICGGGRYDNLLQLFSGTKTALPAVGFGFGDAVIVELLKEKSLLPSSDRKDIHVMVFATKESLHSVAVSKAAELRERGLNVDLVLETKGAKWAFSRADKIGTATVMIISADNAGQVQIGVKCLADGLQTDCQPELAVLTVLKTLNMDV